MVQEKLARHKEEREVMKRPADKEKSAKGVVFDNFGYRKNGLVCKVGAKG